MIRRQLLLRCCLLLLSGALAGAALAAPAATLPYDENAEPTAQLQSALAVARDAHKRVLLVFGANWCGEFCTLYDMPIAKGIPSVVVVTPRNEVVYQTRAGELADARSMGKDGIYDFFKELSSRPAGY